MKVGDIIVLTENHYVYKEGQFGNSWTEIQLYKGDKFEVIGRSEHPFKDWKLKLLDSKKTRVTIKGVSRISRIRNYKETIFDESAYNNHKYMIDISWVRDNKLKQLGIC